MVFDEQHLRAEKSDIKVSSRVKKSSFFEIFNCRWLNRAHQELSFKKFQETMFFLCRLIERKSFLYANSFNWSLTSPVDSYLMGMPLWTKLITQFDRNRGLTVFPWILEVNASKEEKRACPFSSSTPRGSGLLSIFQGSVELLKNVSSKSWLGSKWKLPFANN